MTEKAIDNHTQATLTWIIPVYNGEKYIRQAINSVMQQPCKDFNILVIDDGSTDNTLSVLKSISSKQIRVISKPNGGVSSARNCGIDEATSKYIAFLDADDLICRNAYTTEIRDLLISETYDLLSFSYIVGDQNLEYGNRICVSGGEVHDSKFQLDPFKHCGSFIYRRSMLNDKNAVRFPLGIKIREDVAFQYLVYQHADRILNICSDWYAYRNNVFSVLHQTSDYEFIIQHAIPAWQWCRAQCEDSYAKEQCNIRIFAEAANYIQLSCANGTPLNTVNRVISMPAVQQAISNYEILWSSSKKEYEAFIANPVKYWCTHFLLGLPNRILKPFVRIPLIRKIYLHKKYKENLTAVV